MTHCLLAKPRSKRPGPNATFRRFSLDGTSYNVLLPYLEHQDFLRAKALQAALKANAANLNLGA